MHEVYCEQQLHDQSLQLAVGKGQLTVFEDALQLMLTVLHHYKYLFQSRTENDFLDVDYVLML